MKDVNPDDVFVQVPVHVEIPYSMMHRLSKKCFRGKDVQIMGVSWDKASGYYVKERKK